MQGTLRIAALDTMVDLIFEGRAPEAFVNAVIGSWSRCLADEGPAGSVSMAPIAVAVPVAAPPDDGEEAIRFALQRLSQDVTRRLITAQTGRLLMLHAGAVNHPELGASLVFVAPSGTGKTTLCRLLGRTYGYLTDETVGIEPGTCRIHPYPKPLSIAQGERWRKVETSPDLLGLRPAHPCPVAARLVILKRVDSVGAPVLVERLGLLEAAASLISETSALNRLPRPLRTLADLIDRTGPVVRLTYSEASDLVSLVPRLLEEGV